MTAVLSLLGRIALFATVIALGAMVPAQNVQLGDFFCVADAAWMRQVRAGEERLLPLRTLYWPQGPKTLLHDDRFPGLFYVAGAGGIQRLTMQEDHAVVETIVPATEARGLALDAVNGILYTIIQASAGATWQILGLDTGTGNASAVATCPLLVPSSALVLNPRDNRLYFAGNGELWAMDPATATASPVALGMSHPSFQPQVPFLDALVVDPVSGDLVAGDRDTARLIHFTFGTWAQVVVNPNPTGLPSTSNLAVDAAGLIHYIRDVSSGTSIDLEAISFNLLPSYTWSLPPSFPAATAPSWTGNTLWTMAIISALPYGCAPTLQAASITSVGTGTTGPSGTAPVFGWSGGPPYSGNEGFTLDLSGILPGHPAYVLSTPNLGAQPSLLPGGGQIFLDLPVMMTRIAQGENPVFSGVGDINGRVTWTLPLPTDPCIVGQTMALQVFVVDPLGLSGFVVPYALTNALSLTFGY